MNHTKFQPSSSKRLEKIPSLRLETDRRQTTDDRRHTTNVTRHPRLKNYSPRRNLNSVVDKNCQEYLRIIWRSIGVFLAFRGISGWRNPSGRRFGQHAVVQRVFSLRKRPTFPAADDRHSGRRTLQSHRGSVEREAIDCKDGIETARSIDFYQKQPNSVQFDFPLRFLRPLFFHLFLFVFFHEILRIES